MARHGTATTAATQRQDTTVARKNGSLVRRKDMQAKDLHYIAKTLYAMEQKRRKPDMVETLRNERYARTMSDEHPWVKKPVARDSVPAEVREIWERYARAVS